METTMRTDDELGYLRKHHQANWTHVSITDLMVFQFKWIVATIPLSIVVLGTAALIGVIFRR
jgi:hypothetical protein